MMTNCQPRVFLSLFLLTLISNAILAEKARQLNPAQNEDSVTNSKTVENSEDTQITNPSPDKIEDSGKFNDEEIQNLQTSNLTSNVNTTEDPFPIPRTGRLPTWISPVHYDISFSVHLDNATYDGVISVKITFKNETDKIVLNMLDIVTKNETCKVSRVSAGKENVPIKRQIYDAYLQFYIIQLETPRKAGETLLVNVSFSGTLNSKLVGFYLSKYSDSVGNEIRVASTQFSPTDARRAFPCFDEPKFKATFRISIERDADKHCLSNMPIATTSKVEGKSNRYLDAFEPTLKMSTYIVGFLVSDFVSETSRVLNHTRFAVWSRKEAINQTDYALEMGPPLLTYLEDYFGVQYPLPKLDMAAVPDFKFNGMENWGLIMYRESAMLFDPDRSSVSSKRRLLQVVAHEIAHMWFGNLVTPNWWSELWLKEGFANFMGYKAIDFVDPTWHMMHYLVQTATYDAMEKDALKSSHPINVRVDHPDRIAEIFDAISYNKGASIIRMMQHFLTEAVYKRGMQHYIRELQYDNAVQEDLWHFLTVAWKENEMDSNLTATQEKGSIVAGAKGTSEDAKTTATVNLTVGEVMDTWTLQDGFPVVKVRRNDTLIVLSQERFLLEVPESSALETPEENFKNRSWWIPVSVVREQDGNFENTEPLLWLNPHQEEVTVEDMPVGNWFVLNAQKTGFFRVCYDALTWNHLTAQLKHNHSVIHVLNRMQLLDDSFNLARTGMVNYSMALEMAGYLKTEKEYPVWNVFFKNFNFIHELTKNSVHADDVKSYIRSLVSGLYPAFGFGQEDGSYDSQSMTRLVTKWACKAGHQSCVLTARNLFRTWLRDRELGVKSENLTSNVASIVLCHGIENATESDWNATYAQYLQSNVQSEKHDILNGLGCTKDVNILTRFVDMSLNSSSGIPKQDTATVFNAISRGKEGQEVAWGKITKNWKFIAEYFGSGSSILWRIIEAPTKGFSTESEVAQLEEFVEMEKDFLGSAAQTVRRCLESARLNVFWVETFRQSIVDWIKRN